MHSDFGTLGVFFFPFLLGMVAQWLSAFRKNLVRIMLLAHLYVVVLFSFSNLVITTGQWFQSLVVSLIAAAIIERVTRPAMAQRLAKSVARPSLQESGN